MNQQKMRQVALGAARSEMRRLGMEPIDKDADAALQVLDDLDRMEPDLVASIWYSGASNNQIRLFKREWAIQNRKRSFPQLAALEVERDSIARMTYGKFIQTVTSVGQFAITLHGIADDERLTPKLARQALRLAGGDDLGGLASDGRTTYRVFVGGRVRKLGQIGT